MMRRQPLRISQAGVSLVELMIALVLGLLLMLAVVALVIETSRSHRELTESGRQIENGRYAMELLTAEIQHAGFYGRNELDGPAPGTSPPNPCLTALADLEAAMPLAVVGYDDAAGAPFSCLSDANHLDGTDILVVRRAATTTTAAAELQIGEVYLQATPGEALLALGEDVVVDATASGALVNRDGSLVEPRKYRVDIYFVSPCKQPDSGTCTGASDGGRPIPTLKRLELASNGASPALQVVPLVEGVENLQLDYGVDTTGDGAPNSYLETPAAYADWADVVTVRLNLLMRSIGPSTGHSDRKTYLLGQHGVVGAFNDAYKRHVFSTAVRVVNRSSRREEP